MIIGSHVSFDSKEQLLKSVKECIGYGANTFMFYTGAPQNTKRCTINDEITFLAMNLMKENNILLDKVVAHAPYIVNLANDIDPEKYDFSIKFIRNEIERLEQLNIKYLVLHPGSHVGQGIDVGIQYIITGLNQILEDDTTDVMILLETMAGKGSECGSNIDEIEYMVKNVSAKNRIGVCLDTCHLNDSGVSMSNFDEYLREFEKRIGIDKIKCIHINDSKNEIASHKDRHENIGFGTIGFETLNYIVHHDKLKDVPKILETPYTGESKDDSTRIYPPYKFEIEMFKNSKFNENLYEDIKNYYK